MLSHVTLGTNNLIQARNFYDQVLNILNCFRVHEDDQYIGYCQGIGEDKRPLKPIFWICKPYDNNPASVGNGTHIAFMTEERHNVNRAYHLAISLGASDEGPPGLRPHYHENYYGAFFRDLDGNKIQICCHQPE